MRSVWKLSLVFGALALFAAGCAEEVSRPSLNLLSQDKKPFFIESISVAFKAAPESKTLESKIKTAVSAFVDSSDRKIGAPANLEIYVKHFNDVGGAQSLLIGGDSHLEYAIRITDKSDKSMLYQIDLKDREGYAPGGILGMLAAIGTDRKRTLATQMAQRVNVSVLQANNIQVQKSAIEALGIAQEDIESFRRVASDEKEPDDPLTDDRHGPGNNR
tara:strand:- start:828 stop:1478 length:651 start_codon:yes stop_codon:yes gene_type:complete